MYYVVGFFEEILTIPFIVRINGMDEQDTNNGFPNLLEEVRSQLINGGELTPLKILDGGYTKAQVLLIDIVPGAISPREDNTEIRTGQYILKLDILQSWEGADDTTEAERHTEASNWNEDFSRDHIPPIKGFLKVDDSIAMMYSIAGGSLLQLQTAETLNASGAYLFSKNLGYSLLAGFNANHEIRKNITHQDLMREWLGYRIDPTAGHRLLKYVERKIGSSPACVVAGGVLVNPLWLSTYKEITLSKFDVSFWGMLHGDLHAGNILVRSADVSRTKYWLIDFSAAKRGPLFFDHAYFELSLVLGHISPYNPDRELSLLRSLSKPEDSGEDDVVVVEDVGLLSTLRALRKGIDAWRTEFEPNRHDSCAQQIMLARVAAALNWANKNISDEMRQSALLYGAWYATTYLQTFFGSLWAQHREDVALPRAGTVPDESHARWDEVWRAAHKFDTSKATYVLVTDKISSCDDCSALGMIPWTAIFDFDSDSDTQGFLSHTRDIVKSLRPVSTFGREPLVSINYRRSCAWMLAHGWHSHGEASPGSLAEWRRNYLEPIRSVCRQLVNAISPSPIKVLILNRNEILNSLIARVLEAFDESFGDSASYICVGAEPTESFDVPVELFPVDVDDILLGAASMYGKARSISEPCLPGREGDLSIPIEQLRNIEEDHEVLHSLILSEEFNREEQSTFYRGSQPSWNDLHGNLDVIRDVNDELIRKIESCLHSYNNHVIELQHTPGAGGTTAALRAAWELRSIHPVLILRNYSPTSGDRIDQVYQIVKRPILLVADASILPKFVRDDLLRELAERHVRITILYVARRPFISDKGSLRIHDPMTDRESSEFLSVFDEQCDSQRKREFIHSLTYKEDYAKYRIPFFYGLAVYEKDFKSVPSFVENHFASLPPETKIFLTYAAFVTYYTQYGIDTFLARSFLGQSKDTDTSLDEALGPNASHLIITTSRLGVRILHRVIAEEILRQHYADSKTSWKQHLATLSIEFIKTVVRLAGSNSSVTSELFQRLFTYREISTSEGRKQFADLIRDIPSDAQQHQVLLTLTEECPEGAHFWNHLGRHHIYVMKQDWTKAEEYLQTACTLAPYDRIHQHSLGNVRRHMVKATIADYKRGEGSSSSELLERLDLKIEGAKQCFGRARELAPTDSHGYITEVQLISEVIEAILSVSGDNYLSSVTVKDSVSSWIRANLVAAEELLGLLRNMPRNPAVERYLYQYEAKLSAVIGNHEKIIKDWEALLTTAPEKASLRRALSYAYLSSAKRRWRNLGTNKIRRIVELMEENIFEGYLQESDLITWFKGYRFLPEFDYLNAIGKFEALASTTDSHKAYYYLYILHYLRWRAGHERTEDHIIENLRKCRERAQYMRTFSYEWLATKPSHCPLVFSDDVGKWDRRRNFFPNPERVLERVDGIVEPFDNPRSGTLRLGKSIRAHYVPGTAVWKSLHVNDTVTIYLGFSYEGFRGWDPQAPGITKTKKVERKSNPRVRTRVRTYLKRRQKY